MACNCVHKMQKGNYSFCDLKSKVVDDYLDCRDCPLRLDKKRADNQVEDIFKEIFGCNPFGGGIK